MSISCWLRTLFLRWLNPLAEKVYLATVCSRCPDCGRCRYHGKGCIE